MSDGLGLRVLGSTGLEVTPLCVGTSPLGNTPMPYTRDVPEEDAVATIRRALAQPDQLPRHRQQLRRRRAPHRDRPARPRRRPRGLRARDEGRPRHDQRRLLRRPRPAVGRGEPGAAGARPARARPLPRSREHLVRGGRRARRPARGAAGAQGGGRDRPPRRRRRPDRPAAALHPHRRVLRRAHAQPLLADRPVGRAALRGGGGARRRRAQRGAVRRRRARGRAAHAGLLRLPGGRPGDPRADRGAARRLRAPRRPARRGRRPVLHPRPADRLDGRRRLEARARRPAGRARADADPAGAVGRTRTPRHERAAHEHPVPRRLRLGHRHRELPDRGRRRRGRALSVDLGHVRAHPRQDPGRRHRRRRRRPLPPLRGGRPADGRPRRRLVPLLDRLAARAARRARGDQRGRHRLLRAAHRRAAGEGHHALGHALPLGPPAGAAGRRRLAGARHRGALRRLRRRGLRAPARPRHALDDAQRAVGLGLHRLRERAPRAGDPGRRGGAARGPPPDARPRARDDGDARPGRRGLGVRDHAQRDPGHPGERRPRRRRRGAPGRRAHQPPVLRPAAARELPGGHARGRAVGDGRVPHPGRRPGDDPRPARLPRHQLLLPDHGAGQRRRARLGADVARPERHRAGPDRPAADGDGLGDRPRRALRVPHARRPRLPRHPALHHRERRGHRRREERRRRGPRPASGSTTSTGTSARRTGRSPTASTCAATSCGR